MKSSLNLNQHDKLATIPEDLKSLLPSPKNPLSVTQELLLKANLAYAYADMHSVKVEILPTDPEYAFVIGYFNHQKPPGMRIKTLHYLFDPTMQKKFEAEISNMEAEAKNFNSNNLEETQTQARAIALRKWKNQTNQFSPFYIKTEGHVKILRQAKILPLWQAPMKSNPCRIMSLHIAVNSISAMGFISPTRTTCCNAC